MSDRMPSYRRHKASGQAIVTLSNGLGGRQDVLLGKWKSKASREEYGRVIKEWEASGRRLPRSLADAEADLTISELILLFWPWAEQHYRHADGTPTHEIEEYRQSMRPLKRLYGHTVAKDFGPLALKAVRQAMIDGNWLTEAEKKERIETGRRLNWCRGVVNKRVSRIRRMFRWAVENELVKSDGLHALEAVKGLERGRSAARETEPVKPVPVEFVEATLPFLCPIVADMVWLQLVTGMRPGEVCMMRGIDLDMKGPTWLYRPGSDQGLAGAHKTAHHGHAKIVPIGPQAQEIIRRNLKTDVRAYLFSPSEAATERHARRRAARKSKMTPSQLARRPKRYPKRTPGERYQTSAYGRAIAKAILKANAARPNEPPIPHWHPHQLRHTKATEIRREFGLDAARAVLGHRSPAITDVYAELDLGKAIEVAAKLG